MLPVPASVHLIWGPPWSTIKTQQKASPDTNRTDAVREKAPTNAAFPFHVQTATHSAPPFGGEITYFCQIKPLAKLILRIMSSVIPTKLFWNLTRMAPNLHYFGSIFARISK
jgi:hypothetical protein